MTSAVLTIWRPWHHRLFDLVRTSCIRLNRTAPGHTSIEGLDAHTLHDIGIDAGEMASIRAESEGQAAWTRLRIAASRAPF
jgi:hypothetical protein